MKKLFAVLAFLFPLVATAGFDYNKGPLAVKGYDEPCSERAQTEAFGQSLVVATLFGGLDFSAPKRADLVFEGKGYAACYIELDGGSAVFLIDETGDMGRLEIGTGV